MVVNWTTAVPRSNGLGPLLLVFRASMWEFLYYCFLNQGSVNFQLNAAQDLLWYGPGAENGFDILKEL